MLKVNKMMRAGEVRISFAAFIDLLHLPKGTEILGVECNSNDRLDSCFRVLFSSDECPEVALGGVPMWVNCTIRTEFCNSEERVHIVEGHITK